jgi:hypothetical protein
LREQLKKVLNGFGSVGRRGRQRGKEKEKRGRVRRRG